MALISQRQAEKAIEKAERAKAHLARLREEHNKSIEGATRTAVTMAGAFSMAWWAGRYPEKNEVFGLEASLVVGGGLTLAALMGWAGDQGTIVESLGTGALSAYAVSRGYQMGQEQAQAA